MDRDSFSDDQDIIEILKGLESNKAEYPPDLLTARRKFFIDQVERHIQPEAVIEPVSDHKLIELFTTLKSLDPEYPAEKLSRRRAVFKQRLEEISQDSVWNILRTSIWNIFAVLGNPFHSTFTRLARTAVIASGIVMLAFAAFVLYGNVTPDSPTISSQHEISPAVKVLATPTQQSAIVCENGSEPPLCLAPELASSKNLTFSGNGSARPAVAKDTVPGHGQAAYLNDGLYGPEAGWVSNSPNSWIKIDLGDTTPIDTVAFSRDRLGEVNDGDPGQFVIAVAIADNIYADGNSSNDEREYIAVYNSRQAGFDGTISGSETVIASFDLQRARFIKITFENAGTAIDEVEAFVSRPSKADRQPTIAPPRDESTPDRPTPVPTNTPLPLVTSSPIPTDTPLPVDTATPLDTATPIPTGTAPPVDTATPPPVRTEMPVPTDLPPPEPTLVPTEPVVPLPFSTPFPAPIATESGNSPLPFNTRNLFEN